jgi:hypothetical protein
MPLRFFKRKALLAAARAYGEYGESFLSALNDEELLAGGRLWAKEYGTPGWSDTERSTIKGLLRVLENELAKRGLRPARSGTFSNQ